MRASRSLLACCLLTGLLGVPDSWAARADRFSEGPTWVPLRGLIHVGRTWGHRGGHEFPAIDFEVAPGRSVPVFSTGPGTVIDSSGDCPDTKASGAHQRCNGGQGNFVDIVHPNGRRSRYLHLRQGSVTVEPGAYVCRGCKVGRTGWSGNVSPSGRAGAHLHYEELSGFRLVSPGRMWAKNRTGRVSYPPGGERWPEVGGEGLLIRNAGFPARGPAPGAACGDWAATRVGTAGPDQLEGTSGPDIIVGGDGNDVIQGFSGDDRICGGPGDDNLDGGSHRDLLDGGDGTDTCVDDGASGGEPDTLLSCELPQYDLTVEVRCCFRFVTSQPTGVSCPPDCSETYAVQTRVTLSLSGPGSGEARPWAGCDEQIDGSCVVTMNSNRHVSI